MILDTEGNSVDARLAELSPRQIFLLELKEFETEFGLVAAGKYQLIPAVVSKIQHLCYLMEVIGVDEKLVRWADSIKHSCTFKELLVYRRKLYETIKEAGIMREIMINFSDKNFVKQFFATVDI